MNLLNAIFSTSFGFSVLRVTTPIIFAAMAALITNKAGVMNIALEAIMLFGAFFGTVVSAWTQNAFFGVLAAIGAGIILSMLMAFFAFRMKADLILTGIALNTFASGSTVFLMYMVCNDKASTSGLPSCNVPSIDLPLIKSIPVIGEMISGHNLLTYLAFFSVIVVWILIYKTPLGLRIHAAESVGIKVMNVQFIALFLSGIFAGLGGAFMSMGYLSFFSRDMIAGRGFIALAAQNMGGAAPLGTLIASIIFGIADALSNMLQTLNVPAELVQMQPYLLTIIGLVIYAVADNHRNKA